EVLILQHLVLSHHGKSEWGSPKPPLIQEAELLNFIDMIDAKMNMLNRALDKIKPGEFTERLFAMENRSFYKPNFEKLKSIVIFLSIPPYTYDSHGGQGGLNVIFDIPWWVFMMIVFIFFSGYMSYRAMRAEKELEQQFIEQEGKVYIERIK